jgi:acetyl esterase/lipase
LKIISLLLSILFFLFSLQVIVPVQSYFFWKLTIAATEMGNYLAIIPFILFSFFVFRTDVLSRYISLFSFFSFVLFVIPIINTIYISFHIKSELKQKLNNDVKTNFPAYDLFKSFQYNQSSSQLFKTYTYKKIENVSLTLDLYSNNSTEKKPLIISIHGGAWVAGQNNGFETFDDFFANQGYLIAEINYRLAPKHSFPAPIDDIIDAYDFLVQNSERFHIDTNKVFLLGRSAGGQIAMIAASRLQSKLKGVIAFYTPHDMVWGYTMPGNPLILDSRKVLSSYLGGTYEQAKIKFHQSSSLEAMSANFPPLLMIHGKRDEMVAYQHNVRLVPVLKKYGVPYFLLTLPWATHAGDFVFYGPSGQLSTYAIACFLQLQTN